MFSPINIILFNFYPLNQRPFERSENDDLKTSILYSPLEFPSDINVSSECKDVISKVSLFPSDCPNKHIHLLSPASPTNIRRTIGSTEY